MILEFDRRLVVVSLSLVCGCVLTFLWHATSGLQKQGLFVQVPSPQEIAPSSAHDVQVSVTNTSEHILAINDAVSSCVCAFPDLDYPVVLRPREIRTFIVNLTAPEKVGHFQQQVCLVYRIVGQSEFDRSCFVVSGSVAGLPDQAVASVR